MKKLFLLLMTAVLTAGLVACAAPVPTAFTLISCDANSNGEEMTIIIDADTSMLETIDYASYIKKGMTFKVTLNGSDGKPLVISDQQTKYEDSASLSSNGGIVSKITITITGKISPDTLTLLTESGGSLLISEISLGGKKYADSSIPLSKDNFTKPD